MRLKLHIRERVITMSLEQSEDKTELLEQAEQYVKEQLQYDSSGHDWWHIYRVRKMAVALAKQEGANVTICELAALLHDVADAKLNPSKEEGLNKVQDWLQGRDLDKQDMAHVMDIIANMSYSGGHSVPLGTLEGKIVQDADRLDAIGAIGIGRAFAYGGSRGRLMHKPGTVAQEFATEEEYRSHQGTTIQHFDEKLLKLRNLMHTEAARKAADRRHAYMEGFLKQFEQEWEAEDIFAGE
ncbi:HD domain-containing protein [Paenibacillus sp. FSL K6-1230]|uniref:HD domain-containing protein n=2 Tax=Paenibacillus TaxID=44249 RepID=UPI0030F81556